MPVISIIMGSKNDWEHMKECVTVLEEFNLDYEKRVVSAHRTPDFMKEFAENAAKRGVKIIIAGAGGAAHLPGMTASFTTLPVIGVPIASKNLNGLDSLLSIVQMPFGIPVATVAIGGVKNAVLLAVRILSLENDDLRLKLEKFMGDMKNDVLSATI
jgi:5-(carboxyamino)imidazole ribonucleotide mutase